MSSAVDLVLLSGMLGDATLWDGVVAPLADIAHPRPVRIDLDDSVAGMARSVLAEAPPSFALAGHSLGGIVALEILRQAPERVDRVVLVATSARGPSPAQQRAWAGWRAATEEGGFDRVAAELAEITLPAVRRSDAELVAVGVRMAANVGPGGFLRQLAAQSGRPDSLASLPSIDVPVLVVSGELDEVCPPALQEELVARCPRAEHATIRGAGHMVPLERPDALAEHLRAWLHRTARDRG